jgi:hypothetical protein
MILDDRKAGAILEVGNFAARAHGVQRLSVQEVTPFSGEHTFRDQASCAKRSLECQCYRLLLSSGCDCVVIVRNVDRNIGLRDTFSSLQAGEHCFQDMPSLGP